MRIEWTKQMENDLVELRLQGISWSDLPDQMEQKYNMRFTRESCRNKYRALQKKGLIQGNTEQNNAPPKFKEENGVDFKKGTGYSDKLIELANDEEITEEKLLLAHGYDPNEWKITKVKNSMWQHHNKQDGTKTLLASRIEFEKRGNEVNWNEFLESVKNIEPMTFKIPKYKVKHKQLLEIPIFDPHFGINDYDYYKPTQNRIDRLITSRVWEEIIITIGSDMFHHNDHRNRTAKGTEIQHADMIQAWEDARTFYEPLIQKAIKHSNRVKVFYIKGNHDESLSWAFAKMLEVMYPQVEFDTDFEERKVHTFEKIFIGYTHGDKGAKRIPRLFPAEFPQEWAKSEVRELHAGHIHHEVVKDEFGITMRSLSTRARTDQWHRDNGYVGNHKRFMVFEYSEDELEAIHYV